MCDNEAMSKKPPKKEKGQCLCGAVKFQVEGPPVVVCHCHCRDCQRWTGAGHSTAAMFAEQCVKVVGKTQEYSGKSQSGAKVTRLFCPKCGSSILGRNSKSQGFVSLLLGCFDNPDNFLPQLIVFARSKPHWDEMDPKLPSYETQPESQPEG